MGSESNLKTLVSDKLMTLLGYSAAPVVQYIIGIKAKSPADVVGKLVEYGLSSSAETSAFAEDIFSRVPRKESGLNQYQKQEREAVMLVRKQKTYALLDADDDDDDDASESEEERLRDQREREQLEHNIRERDTTATRRLTERKLSKKEEEEAIRRTNAFEGNDIEDLRKVSRQEYLKKGEQKKLEEIRDDLEDEQYLFDGVKLTEAEYRELSYKKQIYEIVRKRSDEPEDANAEKRFSVAVQRYRDQSAGDKMNPFAEQEAWEDHQIGKATLKFGSKNKKQI